MSRTLAQKKSCMSCVRYLLVVLNIMYIVIGIAVAGVFLWMAIDQVGPVRGVLETDLVLAAVCLLISAGILLIFTSCFGIAAASAESYGMMIAYIVSIVILLLAFASSSVCIAVFKTWLTEPVRLRMEANLRNIYGINLDIPWNNEVTKSWNKAQSTWHCCAAADKSWAIYQESKWFALSLGSEGFGRAYVPESCCERDFNGQMKDRNACLYTRPPAIGDQYSGTPAPVYYRGCYETVKDFFLPDKVSWFTGIFWVGISGALLILFALILGITLSIQISRDNKENFVERTNELEFLSKSSEFIVNNSDRSLALRQTAPNVYMYSMA